MLEAILQILEQVHPAWVFALVGLITASEYIAPFLPGDTVAVLAIALAARANYNAQGVYIASMIGSAIGSMVAWRMGVWLHDGRHRWPRWLQHPTSVQARTIVENGFKRYGAWYLAINRFVPALRSFFFLVAGLSQMKPFPVLVFGTLSAALWNALLLGLGFTLGTNLEALSRFFEHYTMASIAIFVVGAAIFLTARYVVQRVQDRESIAPPQDEQDQNH